MSAIPQSKRLALIVFGAIVVLFFAGYAIIRGLGHPNVPGGDVAVVEDAVPGTGTITKADYDRALKQSAARASIKPVPKPGSAQYDQIKQAALNDLFDTVWIQGEAADRGISITPDQVRSQLRQLIAQNFRSKAEFLRFREQSGFTQKDIRTRVRLQLISGEIQRAVLAGVPQPSDSQVTQFYDAARSQFEQPASRDVRIVLNKDQAKVEQAKAALDQDSSDPSWKSVAAKFSTDPSSKSNGGLRPGITEGLLEQPLDKEIFSAPLRQVIGPVKTPLGYYVFEIEKITPAKTVPLNRSTRAQIRTQLSQQAQQGAFSEFVSDFGSTWRARTFCASDFTIDRCDNFTGGRPSNAPPGCYQAISKGGPPDACPAPVTQLAPALPGSVSVISPQGNRLPQRPIPAGLQPAPTGLTGGGLSPGGAVAPTGGAPSGAPTGAGP